MAAERHSILSGGGEMGALMRSMDWSKTAVGPVEQWPQSLRTALSILLETGFPMYIAWGAEFTQFYNDGYRPILGSTKHPSAMGSSTRQTFAEIWEIIGPMFEGVLAGRPTTVADFMLPLDRHGFVEECYFIYSYSPIREEGGSVGGVLVTVNETTARVLSERRLKTTQVLAAETQLARTVAEACAVAGRVLDGNRADLPFAGIYLLSADGRTATLAAASGAGPGHASLARSVTMNGAPLSAAMAAACPGWVVETATEDARGKALTLPIVRHGERDPVGVLVAGTSERLNLDEAYRSFLALVASQIGTAIAGARALEEAQLRADALAALDHAKTAFFGNVSHEFRTPLTLILGPVEEALAAPERALRDGDLHAVHRNALRLLKLVNTLLDFSRIEAGRVEGTFEPTDLAALTEGLSSAFRSAIERAGLTLAVSCPPLPEPVYVDGEMWEKIVLNLLSNAFKFTFEGSITVELAAEDDSIVLRVRDTGVGIEPSDIGRVFERFHRIERVTARTHEGSGIGLALVKELVHIHRGMIHASSEPGRGTEFAVRIPRGAAHLPSERVAADGPAKFERARRTAVPYVEEALRWLPPTAASAADERTALQTAGDAPHIVVADDNADMREYLFRVLAPRFHVDAVADGAAALAVALEGNADLIISDVMMPAMNGFELIAALRERDPTRRIPVILLSARAGEEARVEGLEAGADDYLVKPFSARELVARVETQLVRTKVRSVEEQHARRVASVFANAPVGVAILRGPDHVFEFANERYLELVWHREVVGKPIRQALADLAGQGIFELLDQVYATGVPQVGRSKRVTLERDNQVSAERYFDFVYQPLCDERGAVDGIAVVAFDVTELTIARREAEAASRAKDEFLAMLGHELRNPLAPIVTALSLMRSAGRDGSERERTIIERQVNHLVGLVDDLLDVSRITRGKVQLKRERVRLAEIVAKAVEMTSPAIDERRHVLELEVPQDLYVDGDASRLAQVIANLLTNAAKYTDAGGTIRVSAARDGEHVVVAVEDSGRGIDPELLPRVFDLFWQERQEIDRAQGGLGLGLAIVKNLVQAHGGSVEAHSAGKGCGSRFALRIPQLAAASLDAVASGDHDPTPRAEVELRVLVVDDNVDAAELLSYSLEMLGHRVRYAFDGPSALEIAAEFAPDVALLDLGLPVMDGFELARSLKSQPGHRALEIVAITGYGQEIDRARTREAGFAAHMVKPVNLEKLAAWLRERSARPAPGADTPAGSG